MERKSASMWSGWTGGWISSPIGAPRRRSATAPAATERAPSTIDTDPARRDVIPRALTARLVVGPELPLSEDEHSAHRPRRARCPYLPSAPDIREGGVELRESFAEE